MTHDYKRNGTTSLFAALEVLQGWVIGQCYERHRHQEFLKFLRRLDQEFPGEIPLHLVMDNYGTHSLLHARPAFVGRLGRRTIKTIAGFQLEFTIHCLSRTLQYLID